MRAFLLTACLAACAGVATREPKSMVELRAKGTVLQRHEYSCGAAALATLEDRFGRPVSEATVLQEIFGGALPLVRAADGTRVLRALTLEDLEKGAREAGFKVVSTQVPDRAGFAEALRALGPGIARMRLYGEYPHFVMLEELRQGWVRVADPGYGSFWMPAGPLFDAWDAGDRVFLTISRRPFYAWKSRDDRPVWLRRHDSEARVPGTDPGPETLAEGVQRRAATLGSVMR